MQYNTMQYNNASHYITSHHIALHLLRFFYTHIYIYTYTYKQCLLAKVKTTAQHCQAYPGFQYQLGPLSRYPKNSPKTLWQPQIWRFPKIGIPPNHRFLYIFMVFSLTNHPFGDFTMYGTPTYCTYRPLEISIPKSQVPWWNQRPAHGLGFSNLLVGPVRRDRWMISQCGETMDYPFRSIFGGIKESKNQRWMVSQVPQLSQWNICPICICDSWQLNEIHELRKCFGMLSFLKTELLCQWTGPIKRVGDLKQDLTNLTINIYVPCVYIYILYIHVLYIIICISWGMSQN